MREQLIQYVELLFAGAKDCEDIRQEILQNTLDRYDDLIAEGKVPEAAYRLAITGIGDINEILGTAPQQSAAYQRTVEPEQETDTGTKKLMRAVAVALYIISMIPLIVLSELDMDTIGFCGTLVIVAVATVLMILGGKKGKKESPEKESREPAPETELQKSVGTLVWTVGLVAYFLVSFLTNAWHLTWLIFPLCAALKQLAVAILDRGNPGSTRRAVNSCIWFVGLILYFALSFATRCWYITWLIFPIIGALKGLVSAILDLKEAVKHEN